MAATTTLPPVQAPTTTVEYFESIYAGANGQDIAVPWADGRPNPALVTWLNAVAPSLVRCGGRVCVVGCGLGDDARELIRRGYDVTAFDCSKTAVTWAKRLDLENTRCYFQADLFNVPARWKHRFDLVVEIHTIQSLTPDIQPAALSRIGELLSPHGHLLVICRGAEQPPVPGEGPPWALTESLLLDSAEAGGLAPVGPVQSFMDDEVPPVRRMRALFKRA
jgi:SAM-dependent methyltransferase